MSDIPKVYRSTDPGAPELTGQAGAFVALMDAVLVDGYGTGPDYKVPLGWTREYSATTKRVFRNDPARYSGNRIRFDDSNDRYVLVDAYAVMSSVDVGVERFKDASQAWAKSDQANSSPRRWVIVGTARCFYVFIWSMATNQTDWSVGRFAGDLFTLGPNDAWRFGYSESGQASYTTGVSPSRLFYGVSSGFGTAVARNSSGSVVGQTLTTKSAIFSGQAFFGASGGYAYPLPTTQGAMLSRVVLEEAGVPRAYLPGVWIAEHERVFDNDQTYSGFVDLGVETQLLSLFSVTSTNISTSARGLFDLTNPWVP